MKILLLCWRDTTHPQGGGSERYLERIGEYLAHQGHEVIYRTAGHTDAPHTSRREGITYLRAGGKYTVYPRAWLAMLAGRFGIGPLAHLDVAVDTQNGIPFFARLFTQVPTVLLTHHCHREQWPVAGPVLSRLGWFLESKVAPRVYRGARYVTVSASSRDDLVELGVAKKDICITPNGIDAIPQHIPHLDKDDRRHLVTLSRLVPHKQIEHVFDALPHLPANVVVDVIGSGWWEDELVAYAHKTGVEDRVVFHGQVTEDYKHALLARADLHVMPSRKEGWGLAVIEAAQHGVPTVGYRSAGGLKDSIHDGRTGVLIDAPSHLPSTIRTLLEDDAYRTRLGENAREWSQTFSWEDTGAQWEEILTDVVATSHSNQD